MVAFLANYLTENSLCVAYDEIANLKKLLANTSSSSEIKLKQKSSCVSLCANGGKYFFKTKIMVPKVYPAECVRYGNRFFRPSINYITQVRGGKSSITLRTVYS